MITPKSVHTLFHGEDQELSTLRYSVAMSKKFNSKLFVWHIIPEWKDFSAVSPVYGVTPIMMDWTAQEINKAEDQIRNLRKLAKQKLEIIAKEENFLDFVYLEEKGETIRTIEEKCRLSDVFVLPRSSEEQNYDAIISTVLFSCKKPVIIVPPEYKTDKKSKNILIAWDGSVEASNAVTFSIPLLIDANVHIVNFEETFDKLEISIDELKSYLELHNVNSTIIDASSYTETVSNNILKLADRIGSELIIMGAWSHRRITELVLGGVTRDMYHKTKYPVFLSH
jgi:nucleotide-binding universal stress UspA family protein